MTFPLLLCSLRCWRQLGKVVGQDGTSTANMSEGMRARSEWDERNNMIDLRTASVPGEKRKEISAENPRAVSLWVREARRAARDSGECGRWEEWGGVNIWLKANLSVPGLSECCSTQSMFAGSQLLSNQTLAAVLLTALLPASRSGEGHL